MNKTGVLSAIRPSTLRKSRRTGRQIRDADIKIMKCQI